MDSVAQLRLTRQLVDIDSTTGLTHATGVTLRPDDRWNFGANAEVGTLVDSQTDAQTKPIIQPPTTSVG